MVHLTFCNLNSLISHHLQSHGGKSPTFILQVLGTSVCVTPSVMM